MEQEARLAHLSAAVGSLFGQLRDFAGRFFAWPDGAAMDVRPE
jgi:hypothetical protein